MTYMNINEIKQLMHDSRNKNTEKTIEKIEKSIKARASDGYSNCRVAFPVNDLENTNFNEVLSYFKEQGFLKIKGVKFQQVYTIDVNWECEQ